MGWIINIISICFIIYTIVIIKKENIPFQDYVKTRANKYTIRDIIAGILIGAIAMGGILLVELSLNYIKVEGINGIDIKLLTLFASLGVMAFGEEIIFRGFMLNGLIHIFKNKYVAIAMTATLFGLAHAGNPNATIISVISNGLGGVMYAIAFIESESIWMPFGLHFAWNFFQGPILGFQVSGLEFGGIIQQSFVASQGIFNGAAYGPEGGLIGIVFRIIVVIMLLLYYNFSIKRRSINSSVVV